jgi:uncharacterized protein
MIPTHEDILKLHKKYAPTEAAFQSVYTHCQIIANIAGELLQNKTQSLDPKLVEAGCLLHDIGVYRLYRPDGSKDRSAYISHGLIGYEILRSEGIDETICRIASHHTGVGLTKEDIIKSGLDLPHEDFLADTPEEELAMYADKFHSKKDSPRFNSFESYKEIVKEFGDDKVKRFETMAEKFGLPDLEALSQKWHQPIL